MQFIYNVFIMYIKHSVFQYNFQYMLAVIILSWIIWFQDLSKKTLMDLVTSLI